MMTEFRNVGSDSFEIIRYKDLPKCVDTHDRSGQYMIVLSRLQAYLYKKKIERDMMPATKLPAFIDDFFYFFNLLIIFICCKHILLIGYLHEFDPYSLSEIEFKTYNDEGYVVVLKNKSPYRAD